MRADRRGQGGEPVEGLLMLADDEGKQRQLEGMAEALEDAETVLANVGVLRGVDDEALVGQGGRSGDRSGRLFWDRRRRRRGLQARAGRRPRGGASPVRRSLGTSRIP